MTTTNDKQTDTTVDNRNASYDPDDLTLGFLWKDRRLVCAGTDGIQQYEPWLRELVEKFAQIAQTASDAVVDLTIHTNEGFVSAIGIDLNRDFNDQSPCSSYFYLGWMQPEKENTVKAKAQSLLWLLENEIYSGDVREMEEKVDELEYRLRQSEENRLDCCKKLKACRHSFDTYKNDIDRQTADREARLTRFFDVLAHRHFESERALVLGPIVQYGELFVFCAKEGDQLPNSRFYLSLWEMVRASGKYNTIEVDKTTRVPLGYRTEPLTLNDDWSNVWESPYNSQTKYYFTMARPDDPKIEKQLEMLIEEGLGAGVDFFDPDEED